MDFLSVQNWTNNSKSDEIIEKLIGENQEDQWEIRNKLAEEGEVFYQNLLTDANCWEKYYPANRFSGPQDLIALPITKTIISKIISAFRDYINILETSDKKGVDEIYKKYNIENIVKKNILNALINGYSSVWLSKTLDNNVNIDTWKAWYIIKQFDNYGRKVTGFIKSYITNDGTIQAPNIKKNKYSVEWVDFVTDTTWTQWNNEKVTFSDLHGLPFTPVIWWDAIDTDEDDRYGIPFYMRFRKLLINLNQLISASHRQILATPTVWMTTKDFIDANNKLSIRPDVINYVGADKELSQTVRNLDLTWEAVFIEKYQASINEVCQLPPKEFLDGTGKIESGIALSIVYEPFMQLLEDMSKKYKVIEEELVKKIYFMEYERELPVFNIEYKNGTIPGAEDNAFIRDKELYNLGILSLDELSEKWK